MGTVALYMRVGHPRQIRRHVFIAARAQHQMPVVGHEAESENLDLSLLLTHQQQINKCLVVARLAEDAHCSVAAIECVIDDSASGGTSGAWHDSKDTPAGRVTQEKVDVTWMSP